MLKDYTEEKLKGYFHHVMDYSCVKLPHNVTRVKYYTMPGKCYHLFVLPIIPVLITDIVKAVSPDYTIIYFDTDTGKKIE